MKSPILVLLVLALGAASIAVGVVHGRLTNRWGTPPDMKEAARKLDSLPQEISGWECTEHDLDQRVADMLQCKGYVNRIYKNTKTGETISVVVLLGPAGPISVHTPEICYSSRDYKISSDRVKHPLDDKQDLWDLRLKSTQAGAAPLRVLYGWTNDRDWHANADPRFAYGGRPLLYKIQLAGPLPANEKAPDPCEVFLSAFLPVLREHLLNPG